MEKFKYVDLVEEGDTAGTRYLKPLESDDPWDLRFELVDSAALGPVQYAAISYTWGAQPATKTITVNGQILLIRPNLFHCLFHIPLEARESQWKYLWVDAICISQANLGERNKQVSRMGDIYREATVVYAWLGLRDPSDAYNIVTEIRRHTQEIIELPYWTRTWVMQELVLAKEVEVRWGAYTYDWQDFLQMLHKSDEHSNGEPQSNWFSDLSTPRELIHHANLPLYKLLVLSDNSTCEDRRDQVFALMGMLDEKEHRPLSRFFPDYGIVRIEPRSGSGDHSNTPDFWFLASNHALAS